MPNPIFGNYHGYVTPALLAAISDAHRYYTKRPFRRDPRLALLPTPFFVGKTVLDVGCNEGWVTCEIGRSSARSPPTAHPLLAHAWGARRVVGVDIDDTLVRAAWKHRRTLWSLQSPQPQPHPSKRIRLDQEPDLSDYFPMSCEQSHGPLPIPAASDAFPHNVAFRTTDWVTQDTTDDESTYDVVIAYDPFSYKCVPLTRPQLLRHEMDSSQPRRRGAHHAFPSCTPRVETGRRIHRRTTGVGDIRQGPPHGP